VANHNEKIYLQRFIDEFPASKWISSLDAGGVLDVGSADKGQGEFYRNLFVGKDYLGVDIEEGPGVDLICNMDGDCKELGGKHFSVVLCTSVLEHSKRPWLMAANIERHLLPFGLLYVCVPYVWKTHGYPQDYWRMNPDAVKILFPHVIWKRIAFSTQNTNEFIAYGNDHDQDAPWRIMFRGRAYIAVQMLHMIGRMN
jgi:2-polyprenyl-3-methyl-5-hydroxy-6-metoxy-1,4-benzoquinol methylase